MHRARDFPAMASPRCRSPASLLSRLYPRTCPSERANAVLSASRVHRPRFNPNRNKLRRPSRLITMSSDSLDMNWVSKVQTFRLLPPSRLSLLKRGKRSLQFHCSAAHSTSMVRDGNEVVELSRPSEPCLVLSLEWGRHPRTAAVDQRPLRWLHCSTFEHTHPCQCLKDFNDVQGSSLVCSFEWYQYLCIEGLLTRHNSDCTCCCICSIVVELH